MLSSTPNKWSSSFRTFFSFFFFFNLNMNESLYVLNFNRIAAICINRVPNSKLFFKCNTIVSNNLHSF